VRIAMPIAEGRLCAHFGHCEAFAILDVDPQAGRVVSKQVIEAPPHQPGLLPRWLAERGVNLVIAGGMGRRAQDLFAAQDIGLIVGAPSDEPEALARAYLEGTLRPGPNLCDH